MDTHTATYSPRKKVHKNRKQMRLSNKAHEVAATQARLRGLTIQDFVYAAIFYAATLPVIPDVSQQESPGRCFPPGPTRS